MIALACASHLLVDLPLFGGPVILLIGGVLLTTRAERRRERAAEVTGPSAEQAPGPDADWASAQTDWTAIQSG
jgi:hypothetical protein